MSPIKIDIEYVVTNMTQEYLAAHPAYGTLRAHCLAKKPVQDVMHLVSLALKKLYDEDMVANKKATQAHYFERQPKQDKSEEERDSAQRASDAADLEPLQDKLEQLRAQIVTSDQALLKISDELKTIEGRITEIDQMIDKQSETLESMSASHQHPTEISAQKAHPAVVRGLDSNTANHHGHPPAARTAMLDQERRLGELRAEKVRLNGSLADWKKKKAEEDKLHGSLVLAAAVSEKELQAMPEKERQRQKRAEERATRLDARTADGASLKQLSATNLTSMQSQIAQYEWARKSELEKLLENANRLSYSTYLSELGGNLHSIASISEEEKTTLQFIVNNMREHWSALEAKAKAQSDWEAAERELKTKTRELDSNKSSINSGQSAIPAMRARIELNRKTIINLEKSISDRKSNNTTFLLLAGVALLLTVGGVVAPLLLINGPLVATLLSVWLIPAAIAGVTTLSLLIITASLGLKSMSDQAQIRQKEQAIASEEFRIEQESFSLQNLQKDKIPQLEKALEGAKAIAHHAKSELDRITSDSDRYLHAAQTAIVSQSVPIALPSAPPAPSPSAQPLYSMASNQHSFLAAPPPGYDFVQTPNADDQEPAMVASGQMM